jgi:hypothetical protein
MKTGHVRWQYRVVNIGVFGTPQRLAAVLSQLGAGGWELVHVFDKASNWMDSREKGFAIFKREVAPGDEPVGPWAAWNKATQMAMPLPKGGVLGPKEDWYPDPSGRYPDRWFDGANWTQWVRDKPGGTRFEDPPYMDLFETGPSEERALDEDDDVE